MLIRHLEIGRSLDDHNVQDLPYYNTNVFMCTHVNIYPNPFITMLSFEVTVEQNATAIVQMLDQDLKIIRMLSWDLKKGMNKTVIEDLESLPAGTYYIDIKHRGGKNLFTTKLAKLVATHQL